MKTTHRYHVGRTFTGLFVIGTMGMSTNCLRVEQSHCMFRGEDSPCDTSCIAEVGGKSDAIESHTDSRGCLLSSSSLDDIEESDDWVELPYGLPPASIDPGDDGDRERIAWLEQLDTGFDASIEGCVPRFVEEEFVEITQRLGKIEGELTERDGCHASVRQLVLSTDEAEDIRRLNELVGEVLDTCTTGTTTDTETDTTTTGDTENTTAETNEGSSTTGGPCMSDGDCEIDTPLCNQDGECVSCDQAPNPADGDMACTAQDQNRPFCNNEECTPCREGETDLCDSQRLWCDTAVNDCVPCTEHAQCTTRACEMDIDGLGRCFPEDAESATVDGDGFANFSSVNDAVESIQEGEYAVITVYEIAGDTAYQGQVLIDQGKIIALLAAEDEQPIITGTGINPGIRIEGVDTKLYIDRISVSGHTSGEGVTLDEAFAWFDHSQITLNTENGVTSSNNASLVIRNSFIGFNGGQFSDTRGISATDTNLTILYSTIAGNDGSESSISMLCDMSTTGTVRNSIVASGTDTIDCPMVDFNFSVVDTGGLSGMDSTVSIFDPGWFPMIGMNDLHIAQGAPFEAVARWQSGDPLTDIDGDPRPAADGAPDYAGADIPLP